jgi:hypothetical protein
LLLFIHTVFTLARVWQDPYPLRLRASRLGGEAPDATYVQLLVGWFNVILPKFHTNLQSNGHKTKKQNRQ